jgi:uncharacterized protein YqfA (UPF0365 family)
MDPLNIVLLLLVVVGVIVLLIMATVIISFFGIWLRARLAEAPVGFLKLLGMRLRRVNPAVIVDTRVMAMKAGIALTTDELEAHYLAGGNVVSVVRALIAASKANINLSFKKGTAIDLAGRDVFDAVQTSVKPKVIDCPDPTKGPSVVAAVAMDGIQIKAKARVTVRTNLETLVGGATEETIIARVGEGIVTTIGSAESYKSVLESPDSISKTVLARGLDVGSAFEILSIDIADVDVGENVGAKLQEAQAEANKNMAQAQAEIRRAAAVAVEQEMKARVQEMQAKVVEAQAQVPLAMAEAFRSGRLGVMDYYKMENVQSDTQMRSAIAHPEGKK